MTRTAHHPGNRDADLFTWRGRPWTKAVARKDAVCCLTRENIAKGDTVWRPLHNGADRAHRLSVVPDDAEILK